MRLSIRRAHLPLIGKQDEVEIAIELAVYEKEREAIEFTLSTGEPGYGGVVREGNGWLKLEFGSAEEQAIAASVSCLKDNQWASESVMMCYLTSIYTVI